MNIVKPMLLSTQEEASSESGWIYEPKYDGIRLLVGNDYSYTRHGTITTSRFPELLLNGEEVLLDGELIAPGKESPNNFEGAMSRFSGNMSQPITYMVFDIIYYQGKMVGSWKIEERKKLLEKVLLDVHSPHIKKVPHIETQGEQLFKVMKDSNMEGMVSKRLGSSYIPGIRSNDWCKTIHWTYHDVIVSKLTFHPFTAHLQGINGKNLGSVSIGFTKDVKRNLRNSNQPTLCKVRSRGWTSHGKLRLPQITKVATQK